MGWLFGGNKTNSAQTPAVTGLQVQTSAYGKCVSFGYGTNRVPPELLWYGAFTAVPHTTGGGGKGTSGATGSTSYTYTTSLIFSLGEGPILGVRKAWIDKKVGSSISWPQVNYPGFTLFTGSYSQTGWSYLDTLIAPSIGSIKNVSSGSFTTTRHYKIQCTFTNSSGETVPSAETTFDIFNTGTRHWVLQVQPPLNPPPGATGWNIYVTIGATGTEQKQNASPMGLTTVWKEPNTGLVSLGAPPSSDTSKLSQKLNYRGFAYLAAANYHLGSNPNLSNHNFEVQWSTDVGDDADPSRVVTDILTNSNYGTTFPSGNVGDMTTYKDYCYATGLFISPLYTDQSTAADILSQIAKMTNSGIVWSDGKLKFVPYGDATVTGNGHTYTPPSSPQYSLDDSDFLPNQTATGSSSDTSDPVLITRKDASQCFNSIRLEYLNRSKNYDPEIVEIKDQALIDTFGLYQDENRDGHLFCDSTAAKTSVALQLQREAIRNYYQFTLDARYIDLDPMDIVAATDVGLAISAQWVRIIEITENDDYSLTFYAEEYLSGVGSTPVYDFAEGDGFNVNYNIDPGNTNAPVIFEAPTVLTTNGGLETWIAVSSRSTTWGGADVYVSTDNLNYSLATSGPNNGRIFGGAITGVLVNAFASSDVTVTIDVSESYGALTAAGSSAAGNNLCWLGGELFSFTAATLISPYVYTLTGLTRAMYGTTKATSLPAGTQFARLDGQIFKFPHAPLQVGQALSYKLLSFNIYGGGQQVLS